MSLHIFVFRDERGRFLEYMMEMSDYTIEVLFARMHVMVGEVCVDKLGFF